MAGPVNLSKPALAKFRTDYLPGRGYAVFSPEHRKVAGPFASEPEAQAACADLQLKADQAKRRKVRPCLSCGHEFQSEGIHNRMCNSCRNRASNDEATPFSFGAIHGRKRA